VDDELRDVVINYLERFYSSISKEETITISKETFADLWAHKQYVKLSKEQKAKIYLAQIAKTAKNKKSN
jgi:hypothetical protein